MTDLGFVAHGKSQKGILFRDTPYSKKTEGVFYKQFVEGGRKWFKSGDEKTQAKYEGDILNGVPNGQGTYTKPNGDQYVGEFKDGQWEGQGTFTFREGKWKGDTYVGEWKNDKQHGQGTYTWSNGSKYVRRMEGWKNKWSRNTNFT